MVNADSNYYVSLEDPKSFRRELLGSTKVIIKLLQRYEILKLIRENKIKLMFSYSKTVTEINMLVNKLKRAIPKTKIKDMPKIHELAVQPSSQVRYSTSAPQLTTNVSKDNNNLDELHDQLAEIESRLNGLN